MFTEIQSTTMLGMNNFSDFVNDEFGRSIVNDIFEPVISEIQSLTVMEELIEDTLIRIDQISEELRKIGANSYGF